MPTIVTSAATVLPVTVDMTKKHTVIDHAADDALVQMYIEMATEHGQNITGRKFVETTFQMDLETFPSGKIKLYPGLQSVDSVQYTDSDGQQQTLDAGEYKVRKTHLVGYIEPVTSWPSGAEDVLIDFNAGWPLAGDPEAPTTPKDIQGWLMVRVAGLYAQRENFVVHGPGATGVSKMPADFIDNCLNWWIVPGYGAGI